ncbi:bifunctional 3-(3-hydroxy-phenyl)propionate/3-hydroxycinnamic acid hydroxylase [Pseudorhodoplanes sinuspersici]|uniref:Uncharacterized protein n=1 Tax=Pseudorhodoplanes sinuspersici TaxID=1235591 RepID=A0A1W6ZQK0_9HYPH|nr:bifunctional 3-(3-hydroxy-phenyl)propionate/3-hydroxycinnamic acid hydroxylase [Pseudorhodoplanes sinuspersici]ARP99612.1 hypothetical protein CAK95_11340 [Pseudorhodoplanes sinuspersici]RKE70586.1 3-(3-hydroxy-phenyl)propionate hydroxylase [Pseudorhodoplanes sinuspersici]
MVKVSYDVAIVGAGPTGLTLANLLGQFGVSVILIERRNGTVTEPRAVSIDDESLRTMQAIGLAEAVMSDCALDYGSYYYSEKGDCFARIEPTTREYGFPRRNAFEQPRLERRLREGLSRFTNVTVLFGSTFTTFKEAAESVHICVVGNDGETFEVEAAYLVGCDGAHSSIRESIGASLVGATHRERWLIVDLAATREQLRQTRVVCNPKRPMITLPGPGGIRRYEFMLFDHEAETAVTDPEFVQTLLAENGPDAGMPIVRRQVYTFHARVADRWSTNRVFLAGDAAHLSPPFAGQGMNSGIRDAHNLGWKLVAALSSKADADVISSYQMEREPHVRATIELALSMGRIMMPRTRFEAWLTRIFFKMLRFVPPLHLYFAQMKYKPKPFYRSGFLISETDCPGVVGRMLPQPVAEIKQQETLLLDELRGKGFTLIAYGRDAQHVIKEAMAFDFGPSVDAKIAILPHSFNPTTDDDSGYVLARDVHNMLRSFLSGVDATSLLVVRPDGYVFAATRSAPESLERFAANCRARLKHIKFEPAPRGRIGEQKMGHLASVGS